MNPAEFKKKLDSLPAQKPDAIDRAMLREAAAVNDGTTVSLEEFKKSLAGYSGRIALRIPRSLHKALKEAAAAEGVSLNQYMIYKLSRPD